MPLFLCYIVQEIFKITDQWNYDNFRTIDSCGELVFIEKGMVKLIWSQNNYVDGITILIGNFLSFVIKNRINYL